MFLFGKKAFFRLFEGGGVLEALPGSPLKFLSKEIFYVK